ncbi:MAG: kinase, partial [Eubacterium sp.]|nr:kinase [Eubacterium sp.]
AEEKRVQLREMLTLVDEAEGVLIDKSKDLDDFGRLLDKTWKLKRGTGSKISTDNIDMLYEKAISAGALGGKLLGAGGGGFFVFYVQPEKQEAVRKIMSGLMHVPFEFENGGTRVVYYSPEVYIPKE